MEPSQPGTSDRATWPIRSSSVPTPFLRSPWVALLAVALIVLAALAAYANSLSGEFVFDDFLSIPYNPSIRHLRSFGQVLSPPGGGVTVTGRPLLNLSLAINYALSGTHTWGYHATNLAIHILSSLVLLGLLWRTFQLPTLCSRLGDVAGGLALAVVLLWTLHPLQTESVTYIVQRAESLAGLFYLLTLYAVLRGAQSKRPSIWYAGAVAACWLGAATKEILVTAPLVGLIYDRTFLAGSFREAFRRRWGLYLGLAASWGLLAGLQIWAGLLEPVQERETPHVWAYLRSQPGVILYYLRLSLWPHPLCLDYEWPVANTAATIVPGVLAVGLLGAATLYGFLKRRPWSFLGIWLLLILMPTSSVLPLRQLAFEHRMYLPLAAVLTAVVLGGYVAGRGLVRRAKIPKYVGIAGATVLIAAAAVVLGLLTVRRNEAYRSELSIWQDTLAKVPYNYRAYLNCGAASSAKGQLQEAVAYYERALQVKPDFAEAHYNLGRALAEMGQVAESIDHYQQAVRIRPDYAIAHNNLGFALAGLGRTAEAIQHYQQAIKIRPDDVAVHTNWGAALSAMGRLPEAIEHYQAALRIQPDLAEAHHNLGLALANSGRIPQAVEQFQEAVRLKPDYAKAHYNLSLALSQTGKIREAVDHGRHAVRLLPDQVSVIRFVAWLMACHDASAGGDPNQAVQLAEHACALTGRRDAMCLDTLAAAYASAGRFDEAVALADQARRMAESAGYAPLAQDIHMRLQLYRDRKPYREP